MKTKLQTRYSDIDELKGSIEHDITHMQVEIRYLYDYINMLDEQLTGCTIRETNEKLTKFLAERGIK